jgi:hypothetical protein
VPREKSEARTERKSEARNPKQIQMTKIGNSKQEEQQGSRAQTVLDIGALDFEFVSDFVLRI